MATTFTLIGSTTIGSGGVASTTFSSIPSTFRDLCLLSSARITITGRSDGALTMNSVTTNNYRYLFVEGYSTNTVYTSNSNATSQQPILINQNDHTANYFSTSQIYICNYNSTSGKAINYSQCDPNNSTSQFYIQTGTSQMTASAGINSLTITGNGGNIAQYSSFHLYGISYT